MAHATAQQIALGVSRRPASGKKKTRRFATGGAIDDYGNDLTRSNQMGTAADQMRRERLSSGVSEPSPAVSTPDIGNPAMREPLPQTTAFTVALSPRTAIAVIVILRRDTAMSELTQDEGIETLKGKNPHLSASHKQADSAMQNTEGHELSTRQIPSDKLDRATLKLSGARALVTVIGILTAEVDDGSGEMPFTGSLLCSEMGGIDSLIESAVNDLSIQQTEGGAS